VAGPEPGAPAVTAPELAIDQYASHVPLPSALEWSQALLSAGIALLVAIVIMGVSKSSPLGMLAAGFLSVVLYRRRCPLANVTPGIGARLGALTGLLGFGFVAASLAVWTALRSGREVHDTFLNLFQQSAAQTSDPRVQQVIEMFNTPEGFTLIIILSLIMTLIAFLIFSSLGGTIAAFLLHRKERQ
jgi:hypothetical protein